MTGRESGKGAIGLIIFLIILGFGIFFLVKYVPLKVKANEFRDEMNRINTDPDIRMRKMNQEQVLDTLLKKAQSLDLPIDKEQITISKEGDVYKIRVIFRVPVDLKIITIYQNYDFKEPREL